MDQGGYPTAKESSRHCVEMDSDGFRSDELESVEEENGEESGFCVQIRSRSLFLFTILYQARVF